MEAPPALPSADAQASEAVEPRWLLGLGYDFADGFAALFSPFGTALGVCTFLVLPRPTVEAWCHPPASLGRPQS